MGRPSIEPVWFEESFLFDESDAGHWNSDVWCADLVKCFGVGLGVGVGVAVGDGEVGVEAVCLFGSGVDRGVGGGSDTAS